VQQLCFFYSPFRPLAEPANPIISDNDKRRSIVEIYSERSLVRQRTASSCKDQVQYHDN